MDVGLITIDFQLFAPLPSTKPPPFNKNTVLTAANHGSPLKNECPHSYSTRIDRQYRFFLAALTCSIV